MALTDKLTAIADAIREKTGKAEEMTLDQMAVEIEGIQSGGDKDLLNSLIDRSITEFSSDIESIGDHAFHDCRNLTKASFPNLTSMGTYCFERCDALLEFSAPNVETIGEYAFNNATNSKKVSPSEFIFPKLKSVGQWAFYSCTTTETFYAPLLTTIGAQAFRNMQALTSVSFPLNTSDIQSTFVGNKSMTFADIGKPSQFRWQDFMSCTTLKTVVIRTNAVCKMTNVNAFEKTPFASGGTGGTVYVPEALIESYKTATNWSTLYAAGTCNFVAIEGSEYE